MCKCKSKPSMWGYTCKAMNSLTYNVKYFKTKRNVAVQHDFYIIVTFVFLLSCDHFILSTCISDQCYICPTVCVAGVRCTHVDAASFWQGFADDILILSPPAGNECYRFFYCCFMSIFSAVVFLENVCF